MPLSERQANLRARHAAAKRHHPDADVSELATELRTETAAEYIKRIVDQAPPLSHKQRARLAALFTPVGGGQRAE